MFEILYENENFVNDLTADCPDGCITINIGFYICLSVCVGKKQK
jgi:hypothetical protein